MAMTMTTVMRDGTFPARIFHTASRSDATVATTAKKQAASKKDRITTLIKINGDDDDDGNEGRYFPSKDIPHGIKV